MLSSNLHSIEFQTVKTHVNAEHVLLMLENSSGDVPRARRQRGAAVQHKGVSHLRLAVRRFCPPPGSWPRRPMAGDRVLMTARGVWAGSFAVVVLGICAWR